MRLPLPIGLPWRTRWRGSSALIARRLRISGNYTIGLPVMLGIQPAVPRESQRLAPDRPDDRWALGDMLLDGDKDSLEAYLNGDRNSERVRSCYTRRSIPLQTDPAAPADYADTGGGRR
jgi:hypothetical protein